MHVKYGATTRKGREMKVFACGSVVEGCEAVFHAESEDQLLELIAAHARQAHGMDEIPPDVTEQIRAKISDG